MVYSLTWFPDAFDRANLKYSEYADWRNRGHGDMGTVRGVIIHHTAGSRSGNMPSLDLVVKGRPDLSGPLAHLGLGRDGTFYIVAAGRTYHAGAGKWRGVTGNRSFIGIEVENHGTADDPYPDIQMDTLRRGVAAILQHTGVDPIMVCGHREFAPGRKIDPLWDLAKFREDVAQLLSTGVPPAPAIPHTDEQARPTLRRGARGPFVAALQTSLGINPPTGNFGPVTEAKLRAWQRERNLVPDGIAGPKTWAMLGGFIEIRTAPAPAAAATTTLGALATALQDAPALAGIAAPASDIPVAEDAQHMPRSDGRNAFGPDGRRFASRVKNGFMTSGRTGVDAFVDAHPEAGNGLTPSAMRAVAAVMGNEGKLEAVNSYDNSFLSFGIMQWTAGADAGQGELAALLSRLKTMDPAAFHANFGQYGLDADAAPGAMCGTLILDRTRLTSAALKAPLRTVAWAYRFWRAGHDPVVRHCQVVHAGGRIDHFAAMPVQGHSLRAWVSSELGMALLLDQHVNRPGHVPGTLERAIKALLAASTVPTDPGAWNEADEDRLIDRYVSLRAGTSMTNSGLRASQLFDLAHAGKLSMTRGSFA